MESDPRTLAQQALSRAEQGDLSSLETLLPVVYDELRGLAGIYLRRERDGHTLQPTALVNELFLKLAGDRPSPWRCRAHFLAVAARAMRQILIDHARRRRALKRENDFTRVTLTDATALVGEPALDCLDVDEALTELARLDERKCRVVELRFFAGLSMRETAEALGVGETTAEDDWCMARAWLRRRFSERRPPR